LNEKQSLEKHKTAFKTGLGGYFKQPSGASSTIKAESQSKLSVNELDLVKKISAHLVCHTFFSTSNINFNLYNRVALVKRNWTLICAAKYMCHIKTRRSIS
jgi:hypothetical protein